METTKSSFRSLVLMGRLYAQGGTKFPAGERPPSRTKKQNLGYRPKKSGGVAPRQATQHEVCVWGPMAIKRTSAPSKPVANTGKMRKAPTSSIWNACEGGVGIFTKEASTSAYGDPIPTKPRLEEPKLLK